jgi:uncharacterized protein YdhG (YjbR/CyaY superfamily)
MDGRMPKASSVEDYLSALPPGKRAVLQKLRATIRAAAPMATEKISYGMPAFHYRGNLVYYAAFKEHCSFFPASKKVVADHADELAGYEMSKGTIRFPVDQPLPAKLVKQMVKERVAENEAKRTR